MDAATSEERNLRIAVVLWHDMVGTLTRRDSYVSAVASVDDEHVCVGHAVALAEADPLRAAGSADLEVDGAAAG